ncbi:MAG TPA: NADH-quinone oxidoreductase subunit N [Syntrophales bacterium]|nr:NADH-quinone oxidoreductase subunit N [Syntrophales bacterium]
MTAHDFTALLPLMILAAAPVVIMLAIAIRRSHGLTFSLALSAVILAILTILWKPSPSSHKLTELLVIDGYALFFIVLILLAGLFTLLLSYGYLDIHKESREEFYILILTALLGSAILVSSVHFASFFLGLEILSVSLYALAAYMRMNERCIEAGIKYLILAAFSSTFLVFGMALVYAETGTMEFSMLAVKMASEVGIGPIILAGTVFIVVGIGFKLALVPFHLWVADVYEGAPAPVTAFIATVSKGAVFAIMLRYFVQVAVPRGDPLVVFLVCVAVASMFAGNLLALFQDNIKRLLAYSSIAHMGYLLVAFLASGELRVTAVVFYLLAYFIMTLGAFGVVTVLSGQERDADRLDDYKGLFFRRPWLAGSLTVMLLSLAGIPLTAGFIGKFYVLAAGVSSVLWMPVICLVVASVIGLFYYLRVIVVLYTPVPEAAAAGPSMPAGVLALSVLMVLLISIGVYPGPILEAIATIGALP